ncbi:hypothetical protein H2O64_16710 [Kordia sp. YSTF-M3]|uniref:Uncharacterized protein n=1 Tax=Kordia aestuariivivens TaxID=2759037 RepID=A0ABR7QCS2_9FLAO|nr:hypothetical protein [Kordia aestuariivivens]MBC8756318.1 hypothetical protein [Kordia aestuariivivens]
MEKATCFDIDTFSMLTTLIQEKGRQMLLHKRLVAGENETAKEIRFENYLIELVTESNTHKIIVIAIERTIPTYVCEVKDEKLFFSAYEARFDIDKDVQDRKDNWCMLVTKILAK